MVTRPAASVLGVIVLATALAAPTIARADLRLHLEGAAAAPMDGVLRSEGSGFSIGGSVDYEVVNLLAVGIFYGFTDFVTNEDQNIYDHAIGARLDLRFVRHRTAGWFGRDTGNAYGEAFIELDLEYHFLGQGNRIGWGIGAGYRVIIAGPFGFGPFFRFRHVVPGFDDVSSQLGHQMYVTFGLELFFSFNVTGEEEEEEEAQGDDDEDDEWAEFESVDEE